MPGDRSVRERVGKLTVGSTVYDLRLHPRRMMPYRPKYELVWSAEDWGVSGRPGWYAGDPNVRIWHMDGFSDGEGDDLFNPESDAYNYSTNCRPVTSGEGLVLGALQSVTSDTTPATFADGGVFGIAHGLLWAGLDNTVHYWDTATDQWHAAGWTAGAGGAATVASIADASDGTLADTYADTLLVSFSDKKIYTVTAGTNVLLVAAANFRRAPILVHYDGQVYALDTMSLYRIDKATGALTEVAAMYGSDKRYANLGVATRQRMSCSDKGPIWLQVQDDGGTMIWEYNVKSDTDRVIGRLPVDFATPYSIAWANGFYFVGFRYGARNAAAGDAYLYYQRGSQRGVAGPFRNLSASSASQPVRIAGVIGDDLIVYFDGAVWGYNLSSGGIHQIALSTTSNVTAVRFAACFGKDIFLGFVNNTGNVERLQTGSYTTGTARWASGRFDCGFQGVDKVLLDVTVVTDPLPANTQITLEVGVEGATAAAVTGTYDTDGQTAYTWTVSSATASVVGREFELFLIPKTTATANTPTIRSVAARCMGAERQRSWVLELDPGTWGNLSEGYAPRSADTLADMKAIGEANGLVKFTNPWDGEEWDAPVDYTVMVGRMEPDVVEGDGLVGVELREASYV